MKLIAATQNKNKLREFREILEPLGFEIITEAEAGAEIDVEETGRTFEENARLKAKAIHEATGAAAMADDSGLCVDALGGEPGVYSARYGGLDDDKERLNLVLSKLAGVPEAERTARFMCAIVFIGADGRETVSVGSVEGYITGEPRGESGFGYDPIFFSPELDKTFAEADAAEKNAVSHRGRALAKLCEMLSCRG
ncbi:MAG: XTP/dITP diphosphatase [Oscillospiraceae bacterium]|nr:XTP/dITP diphosphatase [Oscillospiraceae bacterium]